MNENALKAAFDTVHAPEALKKSTHDSLHRRLNRRTILFPPRVPAYFAAAACLMLLFFGGYHLYFTPTSVISIDINPSLELSVNRFDRVIRAEGYNQDGVQLVQTLDLVHRSYEQAVDEVLNSDSVVSCLAQDEFLSIAVVENDAVQGQKILDYVSACTAQTPNSHCYGVRQEEVSQAHTLGLSYGKYQAYLEIKDLLPHITPEEFSSMTMREIRTLLEQTSSETEPFIPDERPISGPEKGKGNGGNLGNGKQKGGTC